MKLRLCYNLCFFIQKYKNVLNYLVIYNFAIGNLKIGYIFCGFMILLCKNKSNLYFVAIYDFLKNMKIS